MSLKRDNLKENLSNLFVASILAILSGVLLALTFPKLYAQIFVWIGLIPLFFVLQKSSFKQSILYGFLAGFSFFGIVLYWIQIFGYIAWFGLVVILSVGLILFAVGVRFALKNLNLAANLLFIPALWALIEYLRTLGSFSFSWAFLGSSTVGLKASYIASYFGEIGVSFVIVLVNLLLYQLFLMIKKNFELKENYGLKARLISLFVISAIMLVAFNVPINKKISDVKFLSKLSSSSASKPIAVKSTAGNSTDKSKVKQSKKIAKIAIIQANIPQTLKTDIMNSEQIKLKYLKLTDNLIISTIDKHASAEKNGLQDAKARDFDIDLLIWPESALISYLDDEKAFIKNVRDGILDGKTSWLFGSLRKNRRGEVLNSAVYIDWQGDQQIYDKIHLVPFGEYVPFRNIAEKANNMVKLVEDKTPGKNYVIFNLKQAAKFKSTKEAFKNTRTDTGLLQRTKDGIRDDVSLGKFATVICFESSDSRLIGKLIRKGAQLIIVLTNDGWFGNTAALEQHFQLARMRAIEYGVPVVQAANTGISGIIDEKGNVIRESGKNRQEVIVDTVRFSNKPSLYSKIYLYQPLIFALLIVLGFMLNRIRPYSSNDK